MAAIIINGAIFDSSSVEIRIDRTFLLNGVQTLDHDEGLEGAKEVYQVGDVACIGTTTGKYKAAGKIEILAEMANDFERYLTGKATGLKGGYAQVKFDLTYVMSRPDKTMHVVLKGVRAIKRSSSTGSADGGDPLKRSYDLMVMMVSPDGRDDVPSRVVV